MLTSTHMLLGAAAATKPHFRTRLVALALFGGLLPDLSIVIMFAYTRVVGMQGRDVWRAPDGLYWQEPWQTFSAISNSIPLWMTLSLIGIYFFKRSDRLKDFGLALLVLSFSCLLHVLGDFPVHTDDAHVHFWPFSDWRFNSPVSYYQSSHYGDIFRMFEMTGALALTAYLVVLYKTWGIRIVVLLLGLTPVVMPLLVQFLFRNSGS